MMGIFLNYIGGTRALSDAPWNADAVAKPPVYNGCTDIPNVGSFEQLASVADVVDTFGANLPTSISR
jgi:hypothetical protein